VAQGLGVIYFNNVTMRIPPWENPCKDSCEVEKVKKEVSSLKKTS